MRDSALIDCFVGERQNGLMKLASEAVSNTRNFEVGVLSRILTERLQALVDPQCFHNHLLPPLCTDTMGLDAIAASCKFRGTLLSGGISSGTKKRHA